jgi:hypothetical protein
MHTPLKIHHLVNWPSPAVPTHQLYLKHAAVIIIMYVCRHPHPIISRTHGAQLLTALVHPPDAALAAEYPPQASPKPASPKPRGCYKPATSDGDKYGVEITTYNRYIKNFKQIEDMYRHFFLRGWPNTFSARKPLVNAFRGNPIVARGPSFTKWGFAVRVYLRRCPRNAKEQAYKEHIRMRAKAKLMAIKHRYIYRVRFFKI